jgi:hypothetical protein
MEKKQRRIVTLGNFEMSPSCHGNRKFKTEHVVTKTMVQSTFVPSLISIQAVFIVLYQLNENSHFSQNAHVVMGLRLKKSLFFLIGESKAP